MHIYKLRHNPRSRKERLARAVETLCKLTIVLVCAAIFAATATTIWYFIFFKHSINVGSKYEVVSTAAWLPWLAIGCSIFNGCVLTKVLDEFKELRCAIKRWDLEEFMRLKNEDMTPLLYLLAFVFDIAVVGGFMLIDYADVLDGALFVWTSSYMVALLALVIRELDDPLAGVWFIKNVPQEWLDIDPVEWAKNYHKTKRAECAEKFKFVSIAFDRAA